MTLVTQTTWKPRRFSLSGIRVLSRQTEQLLVSDALKVGAPMVELVALMEDFLISEYDRLRVG
jgi:hypothetical protein